MRRRRRSVPVATFDEATDRWVDVDTAGASECDGLTLATFNIWFNEYHAERRYDAIAELLSRNMPDIMVFQEVTPTALATFLAQAVDSRALPASRGDRGRGRQLRTADAVQHSGRSRQLHPAADPPGPRLSAGRVHRQRPPRDGGRDPPREWKGGAAVAGPAAPPHLPCGAQHRNRGRPRRFQHARRRERTDRRAIRGCLARPAATTTTASPRTRRST